MERKEFDSMLKYMQENEVKIVLIEMIDRFHRPNKDINYEVAIRETMAKYGIEKIIFPKSGIIYTPDGMTADSKFTFRVLSASSVLKSDKISEDVQKAQREKVERGEPICTSPLGYKSIRKDREKGIPQQIVQTEAAEKVKNFLTIFNEKRYSLERMLELARNIGLKSSRGNPLKVKEDARRIIRNRFYYGEFEAYGKIHKIKTKGYQPLITKKMWEENQQILEQRRTYIKPDNGKKKFLFSQFVYCGGCGRLLYVQQFKDQEIEYKKKDGSVVKKKYSYEPRYVCTGKNLKEHKCTYSTFWESEIEKLLFVEMSRIELNSKVWDKIKSQLFRDEEREFIQSEIDYLNKEQTRNETHLDNLYYDCKEKRIISETYMSRKMAEIEKEQARNEEKLSELKDTLSEYHEKIGRGIEILDSLKSFRDKWKEADAEKKKQMLKLLTIKISTASRRVKDEERVAKGLEIFWNNEVIHSVINSCA